MGKVRLSQEGVVFALALFLFVAFSLTLNNFLTSGNLIALVRSVAILGILGLGMGLVVIGRGIDLAMVATMVVSLSWVLSMAQSGVPLATALLLGALLALGIGLLSGILVAYADIPAIFTTLAMGLVAYGAGRAFLFQIDVQNTPAGIEWFNFLGTGVVLGIPMPIVAFGMLAALLAAVLRYTRFGRFVYAAYTKLTRVDLMKRRERRQICHHRRVVRRGDSRCNSHRPGSRDGQRSHATNN